MFKKEKILDSWSSVGQILMAIVAVLFMANFFLTIQAQGKVEIENFEAIPGQEGNFGQGRTTDFIEYLQMIYNFGIALAVILAIFMIAFGAFMYVVGSAGNVAKVADAKSIIMDAILGLIMALTAWLILFVINPDFIKSSIAIDPIPGPSLPSDSVCEKPAQNGSEGNNGQCKSLDGKKLACWEGKCEYVCYDEFGQAREAGYEDPKCGTISGIPNSICMPNRDGTVTCQEKKALRLGDPCGPPTDVGGFLGQCKNPVGGNNCPDNELLEYNGPNVCTNGTICCVKGDAVGRSLKETGGFLRKLGSFLERVREFQVPFIN
ncbi:MAG TPA: hypothetical protein GX706_01910 [Candidatus Moranbacteria bacterium]|nr:hypothetical protein [Candidatus Moranbacteria bacterium]